MFKLKTALEVIYLSGGASLAAQDQFKRMLPKNKNYDSSGNKTYRDQRHERNQSDFKRGRREKSMKGRGTSKSRKR